MMQAVYGKVTVKRWITVSIDLDTLLRRNALQDFLSAYVVIIVVFADHTVMMEHRTDTELCGKGGLDEKFRII